MIDATSSVSSNHSQQPQNSAGQQQSEIQQQQQKRKRKILRACVHCQKSHLTCDEGRPCARCVKRGLSETCVDGKRRVTIIGSGGPGSFLGSSPQTDESPAPGPGFESTRKPQKTPAISSPLPQQLSQIQQQLSQVQQQQQQQQQQKIQQKQPGHPAIQPQTQQQQQSRKLGAYDYQKSFAILAEFIRARMDAPSRYRICTSLARVRPYILSILRNLTDHDLIFMEMYVHRMITEIERMLPHTGTPTCVWRRTGEVLMASHEFLYLTGYSRHQLLRMFMHEIMTVDSTVAYWESFATCCFEFSKSATIRVQLVTGSPPASSSSSSSISNTISTVGTSTAGASDVRVISFVCCFTVKTEFDLPVLIVGHFLPILKFD